MRLSLFSLLILLCFAGCSRSRFLKASDGVQLGYEYQQVKSEKGTAVLLHGLGTDAKEWDAFADFLHQNGWSTFVFDFRGHGQSTKRRGRKLDWQEFTAEDRQSMIHDVEAAVSRLKSSRNIWLIGSSIGSNLALQNASKNPEIRGVVLLSPGLNYGGVRTQPAMEGYGARPVLIAGSREEPGMLEGCEILFKMAVGPKKLLRYEKAGHGSAMLEKEMELRKEILEWLNQKLV